MTIWPAHHKRAVLRGLVTTSLAKPQGTIPFRKLHDSYCRVMEASLTSPQGKLKQAKDYYERALNVQERYFDKDYQERVHLEAFSTIEAVSSEADVNPKKALIHKPGHKP